MPPSDSCFMALAPSSEIPCQILKELEDLIESACGLDTKGSWNPKGDLKKKVILPLKRLVQSEDTVIDPQALSKTIKTLSRNPHHLDMFHSILTANSYQQGSFKVLSLSGITSIDKFQRLGYVIQCGYSYLEVLTAARSDGFRSLHNCPVVGNPKLAEFNEYLGDKLDCYIGPSEAVARAYIDAHLDCIFSFTKGSCSILELWLAQRNSRDRAVEVRCGLDDKYINWTCITGRCDYLTITVTTQDQSHRIMGVDKKERIIRGLGLNKFKGTYSDLSTHFGEGMHKSLEWEALVIEAKRISWFSTVPEWKLYQTIATCCLAGQYGRKSHRVIKFCISSGVHWIFGLVNNDTATAFVTDVIDNKNLTRTADVLLLLVLWMHIPGPILAEHLFSRCSPTQTTERYKFPGETEDSTYERVVRYNGKIFSDLNFDEEVTCEDEADDEADD